MKRLKSMLATLAMLLCTISASAEDFSVDGIYYNITDSEKLTVEVTYRGSFASEYSNEYSGNVVIPQTVTYNNQTYSVTSIYYAFHECSSLTSVTIPNSVTIIGYGAFQDCSSLTSVTIPNSVTRIGDYTFCGCSSLTSVTIPNSVTIIGNSAFSGCSSLTSVTIPDGVTSIGEYAFTICSSLTSVTIGAGVTSTGSWTFSYCSNLTSVTIPDGVTSIGDYTFLGCSSLTSVTIPNSVTSIGYYAFYNCSGLTSVTIPDGVTSIDAYAFLSCRSLTSVKVLAETPPVAYNTTFSNYDIELCVPEKSIETYKTTSPWSRFVNIIAHSFEVDGIYYNITDSEKLTVEVTYRGSSYDSYSNEYTGSVVIPKTVTYESKTYAVTSIGSSAFRSCSSLASVTIPDGVTSIGDYAFGYCRSLTSVTIPDGVTSIGDDAFRYCNSLTSVTIPDGVTSIGDYAFRSCSSLTSVHISDIAAWCNIKFGSYDSNPLYYAKHLYMNGKEITELIIPDGVTSIGNSAFENCSSLTSVTIPNSVTSIGDFAFRGCSSLTSVTIPNGVTSIGNSAFEGCRSLTSVTIPNGVTSIGNSAFENCSSLTSVHISDIAAWCNIKFSNVYSNPLYYAEHLYMNGKEITELIIPDGVTSIGDITFSGCSSLTSVTIPNSVTSIGDFAFRGCSSLTSVTIPNSVTNIGDWAFSYCSSLTSVTIPNGVTSIGNQTFYNCSSLTSVTIPNSVTSIGNYVFSGCSSLTSVTIPNSVTSIGNKTFNGCSSLTSVTIPNSVTSIGDWAFNGCSSLTSVTIPNSVTNIGDWAFSDCSSLTSVKVLAETPPFAYDNTFSNYEIELCVPEKSLEIYKATSPWSSFVNIIASTTTLTIGSTGSTTFSSIYNLDFSNVDGLKAYTATGYNSDNGELTLVRIKEAKAGTGLYVSGTPGTYTIPTILSTSYNSLNMFVGVNEETTISTTDGIYTNYIYTKPTGKEAGFYKVTSDRAIPAGKAYLQIPTEWLKEETASEAKAVKLVFDDGESTDIDEVNRVESKEDVIYDLQGRRVKNPSKGIYIINGKKVVR